MFFVGGGGIHLQGRHLDRGTSGRYKCILCVQRHILDTILSFKLEYVGELSRLQILSISVMYSIPGVYLRHVTNITCTLASSLCDKALNSIFDQNVATVPKLLEESESVETRGITVETKNEAVVAEQSY